MNSSFTSMGFLYWGICWLWMGMTWIWQAEQLESCGPVSNPTSQFLSRAKDCCYVAYPKIRMRMTFSRYSTYDCNHAPRVVTEYRCLHNSSQRTPHLYLLHSNYKDFRVGRDSERLELSSILKHHKFLRMSLHSA